MNNTTAAKLLILRDEYKEKLEEFEKQALFYHTESEVVSLDYQLACQGRNIYKEVVEEISDVIIRGLALEMIYVGR